MFAECADHRYRIRPAARSTAVHEPLAIHGQICEYLIPYTFCSAFKSIYLYSQHFHCCNKISVWV